MPISRRWSWGGGDRGTHYVGCWKHHIDCAINVIRDNISEIDEELETLRPEEIHQRLQTLIEGIS